jgi:hypothetical protein
LAVLGQNSNVVPHEPLSPELALVDPELRARARAALPDYPPAPPRRRPASVAPEPAAPAEERHRAGSYPLWARLTAALWILVLGILIGGTAVPHAQDNPRVVPPEEDAVICERPQESSARPVPPLGPIGNPGSP